MTPTSTLGNKIATRKAYGQVLAELGKINEQIIALDAEVSNSTFSELFKKSFPERFIECYIAEQNMVSMALGLSKMGKIPFVSTFAAFLTRAADQIRMSQYSEGNIKFVGSHAGVSIGEDGSSQMALEDLSLFRCILGSVVLYPSDSVSTHKLVSQMVSHKGISYLRTTRADTDILYNENEKFEIGGSKILKTSTEDQVTVVAAGITLHEALAAYEMLQKEGIPIRVIDLYSIKPIDQLTLKKAVSETQSLIVVEDHYPEGGMFEAVCAGLASTGICKPIHSLAVRKMSCSGKPQELLEYEEIDRTAIYRKVKEIIN